MRTIFASCTLLLLIEAPDDATDEEIEDMIDDELGKQGLNRGDFNDVEWSE